MHSFCFNLTEFIQIGESKCSVYMNAKQVFIYISQKYIFCIVFSLESSKFISNFTFLLHK